MLKKLLLFAILSPLALQPVMQANVVTDSVVKVFSPWNKKYENFNKGFELGLGVVGLGIQIYDFCKPKSEPIYWLKKALAINEFYRVGTTFRGKSKNYIDHSLSIMRMLGIFGGKIAETPINFVYTKAGLPTWENHK